MEEQKYKWVAVVAVIVLAVAAYYWSSAKRVPAPENTNVGAGVGEIRDKVSSPMGKTNPFDVNVNPLQGYNNPFE